MNKDFERSLATLTKELTLHEEMTDTQLIEVLDKIKLAKAERESLEKFLVSHKKELELYPINDIFDKYLEGYETYELNKLFPMTSLGGVTYLKIKYGWPQLRQDFLSDLQYRSRLKAIKTKYETISFLSDIVNTFVAKNKDGLYKYVMSGGYDSSGLPARFKVNDFTKLARYINLISKIADIKTEAQEPSVTNQIAIKTDSVNIGEKKPIPLSGDAENLLKNLYSRQKEEDEKRK